MAEEKKLESVVYGLKGDSSTFSSEGITIRLLKHGEAYYEGQSFTPEGLAARHKELKEAGIVPDITEEAMRDCRRTSPDTPFPMFEEALGPRKTPSRPGIGSRTRLARRLLGIGFHTLLVRLKKKDAEPT